LTDVRLFDLGQLPLARAVAAQRVDFGEDSRDQLLHPVRGGGEADTQGGPGPGLSCGHGLHAHAVGAAPLLTQLFPQLAPEDLGQARERESLARRVVERASEDDLGAALGLAPLSHLARHHACRWYDT